MIINIDLQIMNGNLNNKNKKINQFVLRDKIIKNKIGLQINVDFLKKKIIKFVNVREINQIQ